MIARKNRKTPIPLKSLHCVKTSSRIANPRISFIQNTFAFGSLVFKEFNASVEFANDFLPAVSVA